jgi:hypothetical protein
MPDDHERPKPAAPRPVPDQDDLLSPSRSLRESAARGGGQRIGNNGPLANPDVSFPDEGDAEDE